MSMTRYIFTVSADKGKADCGKAVMISRISEHRELVRKNEAAIKSFLGTHSMTSEIVVFPVYYGELLAWALKHYMERNYWQIIEALGYRYSEPEYANIHTDYHKVENLLMNGQLLIDSGDRRLVITVDARGYPLSWVMVGGSADNKLEVRKFADGIKTVSKKGNYYRNKKVEFDGHIRFMDVCEEPWGNINLAPAVKEQIKASTIDLLGKNQTWTKHGLPLKRCVLLTGGEDKKAICRALMAEAFGITCIITNARNLDYDCAVQLYDLARDLSPSIVFVEDIDRMGQNRIKCDYYRVPSVLYLLTILASVEDYEEIVTMATASYENTVIEAMLC